MSALRVVVVYPDLLGTYGDGGNGLILLRRAQWRGIDAELLEAPSSERLPEAELYCLGGGEDGPQVLAARRLQEDGRLASAVAGGATVLGVCAGFQLLGETFPDASGAQVEGLGLLGMRTIKGTGRRAVGELAGASLSTDEGGLGIGMLSGFENHSGRTQLDEGTIPLARVVAGVGNGGGDGSEGAVAGRVVGTYLHGPVLARNPQLADRLLEMATGTRSLVALDDRRELALHDERLASVSQASGRG